MATIIKCDLCDRHIGNNGIKVTMHDGIHPTNSNFIYKRIDCCIFCAEEMELKVHVEFKKIREKIQKKL
jgi:hypothetical protein